MPVLGVNLFNRKLKKWANKLVPEKHSLFQKKVALMVLNGVVLKTPVGKVLGGRLRGNWQVTINSSPSSSLDVKDKVGGSTMAKGEDEIMKAKFGDKIYITNNVTYAVFVEEGTPRMAPVMMLGLTLEEIGLTL